MLPYSLMDSGLSAIIQPGSVAYSLMVAPSGSNHTTMSSMDSPEAVKEVSMLFSNASTSTSTWAKALGAAKAVRATSTSAAPATLPPLMGSGLRAPAIKH